MDDFFEKIKIGLYTYREAIRAIARQYDVNAIYKIQNAKLRRLINYAYNHIKYYRELFEQSNLSPEDIRTIEDLPKIPILTKNELRKRFWDFLPRQLPACRLSRTSGSTGVPICLLTDNRSKIYNSAAVIRYRKALNIPIIGRPILTPLKTDSEPYKKPHWTFLQGLHKTYYINPYNEANEHIEYACGLLKQLKKPAFIGITPAIRATAYRVRDKIFPYFAPSAILSTGERLNTEVRELLETTFHTKVTDIYACNEAGDIAWQCHKVSGYHINAENCVIEIFKEDKPAKEGQIGEVVISNLNCYSMPIIRYKNGDLAKFDARPCACGSKLPLLAEIYGRTGEDFFLADGKTMPWNRLKSLMNHPQICQFQLIQNEDGSVVVKYIAEIGADIPTVENLLRYRFRNLLGNSVTIGFLQTKKIPPGPSGKSKLVVSKFKPQSNRQVRTLR